MGDPLAEARAAFPRGLVQPGQGYRFSLDSLLLACFADPPSRGVGLDLGAGCGVVGLGLLLRHAGSDLGLTGIDRDPAMVAAAAANARLLGLEGRFRALALDVADVAGAGLARGKGLGPESVDFALCNPPYRRPGSGRRPRDPGRDAARFEIVGRLEDFLAAAALVLKKGRPLWLVFLPEGLERLVAALAKAGLAAKRLRFVHARQDGPARMLLAEAVRSGRPGLAVEPPLVLHQGRGRQTSLTPEALAFCPFLACNAGAWEGRRQGSSRAAPWA